jgi:hypothetical protein
MQEGLRTCPKTCFPMFGTPVFTGFKNWFQRKKSPSPGGRGDRLKIPLPQGGEAVISGFDPLSSAECRKSVFLRVHPISAIISNANEGLEPVL